MFFFDTWLSPLTWLVDLVLNVSVASSCLGKGFCVKSFIMTIIPWWKTSWFIRTNVTLKGFFLLYWPSQDVFWSNKRRGQKVLLMVSWFLAFDAHFKPSMISDEERSLKGIRNSLNYLAPGEKPLNYANIFSLRKSRFTTLFEENLHQNSSSWRWNHKVDLAPLRSFNLFFVNGKYRKCHSKKSDRVITFLM